MHGGLLTQSLGKLSQLGHWTFDRLEVPQSGCQLVEALRLIQGLETVSECLQLLELLPVSAFTRLELLGESVYLSTYLKQPLGDVGVFLVCVQDPRDLPLSADLFNDGRCLPLLSILRHQILLLRDRTLARELL